MSLHAEIDRLARVAVDCGYRIHRDIGPGLLEAAYEALMCEALRQQGLIVERQIAVPLRYGAVSVEVACRADIVVERRLLIELKSVERNAPVHAKQVLTYLRLMRLPVGLLMNFGLATFRDGVQRIANGHQDG